MVRPTVSQQLPPWNPECPVCGQGGLHRVRLLALVSAAAVLCEECDALWFGETICEVNHYEQFQAYMKARGLRADWCEVEILD
jgi:transcription elongation factor Elf1